MSASDGGSDVPMSPSTAPALIVLTPVKSPAGRHGDWCCRCRSSVCWSSLLLPAAAAAYSSANTQNNKQRDDDSVGGERHKEELHCFSTSPALTTATAPFYGPPEAVTENH